jgi:hypothetical protein
VQLTVTGDISVVPRSYLAGPADIANGTQARMSKPKLTMIQCRALLTDKQPNP